MKNMKTNKKEIDKEFIEENKAETKIIGGREVSRKLGFLRAFEVYLMVSIMFNIAAISVIPLGDAVSPDGGLSSNVHLDGWSYLSYLWIISDSIILWMIINRKIIARKAIIFVCLLNISIQFVHSISDVVSSAINLDIFNLVMYILDFSLSILTWTVMLIYLLRSKKLKVRLDQKVMTREERVEASKLKTVTSKPNTLSYWRNILLYFMLFSFAGHFMEFTYSTFLRFTGGYYDPTDKLWFNLFDPYYVYGFGCVIAILVVTPVKNKASNFFKNNVTSLIITILVGGVLCTAVEFFEGMLINQEHQFWDYSDRFLNFNGQICMQNSIAFGLVVAAIVWIIYPLMDRNIHKAPDAIVNLIFIIVLVSFCIATAFYELKSTEILQYIPQDSQEEVDYRIIQG
jgi:uncharacterized membrane protein